MSETKLNAIIGEIEQQRNWALTRCASLVAEIVALREEIESLKNADKKAEECPP